MKKIITLLTVLVLALCCVFSVSAEESTTELSPQGVEGDVIQVLDPEEIELHLGSQFANRGFTLKLDYGMYPETFYADEYGVLRLGLGGSDTYVITYTGELKEDAVSSTSDSNASSEENQSEAAETTKVEITLPFQTEPEEDTNKGNVFGIVLVVSALAVLGAISLIATKKSATKKKKKK